MLVVRLRQPKHLAPPKSHQRRCLGDPDPAIRQILQHAHPVDLRPAHRNHRHRPNAPQLKLRRVTSLSGVYTIQSRQHGNGTSIASAPRATPTTWLRHHVPTLYPAPAITLLGVALPVPYVRAAPVTTVDWARHGAGWRVPASSAIGN